MESQHPSKSGNSECSDIRESSQRSDNESSRCSKKEGLKQSERSSSERSDRGECSQQPRPKYGSQPPENVSTDAELSQWILEAEQEDRRLAAIERAKKRRDGKSQRHGSGSPAKNQQVAVTNARPPNKKQWCKCRLPSASPVSIPKIPYDPFDKWWLYHELRRRRASLLKKTKRGLCELDDDGFDIKFRNDFDDDSDNELSEKSVKYCTICNNSPTEDKHEIEITVDQVIKIAVNQEIAITANQEIEIAEDAVAIITSPKPAAQETQANTTVNRIKSYLQRFLNFRTISSER